MPTTIIRIPTRTLIVLCGPAGAGKSTFAGLHFKTTEIVSSDSCRGLVCDHPHNQQVNRQAFSLFNHILKLRLGLGRLSVADSTALEAFARAELLELAREAKYQTCLLVFALAEDVCQQQNEQRTKPVPIDVVYQQHQQLYWHTLREIEREPWDQRYIFDAWPQDLRFVRARASGVEAVQEGSGGVV